jgi:hypothetical protein
MRASGSILAPSLVVLEPCLSGLFEEPQDGLPSTEAATSGIMWIVGINLPTRWLVGAISGRGLCAKTATGPRPRDPITQVIKVASQ